MPRLVVRLLGGFRVELDGKTVYGFETDKARALLAYLIVEADRPHRREALAGLLWPDRPDTLARASLRQALTRARRALCELGSVESVTLSGDALHHQWPHFLFVTSTDVQFNAASDYALDARELEFFARSPKPRRQLLSEAYCADFLAGFALPDSEAFQAWALNMQEYYHRLALDILEDQNAAFEASGDFDRAVAAARLQLRMEPWLEEAHRQCMRGLALGGRCDEALHQYELCRQALHAGLGVEPAVTTQTLADDIRAGRFLPKLAAQLTVQVQRHRDVPSQPRGVPPLPAKPPAILVAREEQLGHLERYLQTALAGETAVAFVSGDAGSGKTALLESFAAAAVAEHPDLLAAGARCNPAGAGDAFGLPRRLTETLFGDLTDDAAWRLPQQAQSGRLLEATTGVLSALAEHGPGLVGSLIPVASIARRAGRSAPSILTHPASTPLSQGALFDQLIQTLAAISRDHPLLLLFDDLHGIDDSSAAFLLHLGRELSHSRLLVLGAYRSTAVSLGRRDSRSGETIRHPLAEVVNELRRRKGEILIDLDKADGRAFVEDLVDLEPNRLGGPFRDALYAQTGGHPLFTTESLRNLQDRGELFKDEAGRWVARESLDWGCLPVRVEAAIAERIERLPEPERRILSVACVQGDDFSSELVAELTGMPAVQVMAALSGGLARQHKLVRSEGFERMGRERLSIYRFTHHLFQKYLYDELDPVERGQLHVAVAASLDRQVGDNPGERERIAPRLAWHYEAGGLALRAARALLDAGRQAMRVSAFRDALERYDHALALLENEPASPERIEIVRRLEVARLGPERNLEGLAGAGLQGALARAEAVAAEPGGESQRRPDLMMLVAQTERQMMTGQFEDALALAEQLRVGAIASGEEEWAGLARFYVGVISQYRGDPRESERHFEWVLKWLTPQRQTRPRAAIGIDVAATALGLSALNRWYLGDWEGALARSREAISTARADLNPVGQACSTAVGARLLLLLRTSETEAQALSEECHRICTQHGLGMWRVYAEVSLGRLMALHSEYAPGIERMLNAGWQSGGMVTGTDAFVTMIAESCLVAAARARLGADSSGDGARARFIEIGLNSIAGLFSQGLPCGQSLEAELRRLRGELILERDGVAGACEARACFRRAIEIGREQGAPALELRAAMALVRLHERERLPAEQADARRCLAQVMGRFAGGFTFPDLQDAAALVGTAR